MVLDRAIREEMLWQIEYLEKENKRIPVFDHNEEIERKKLKKLIKSLKRVYNYYSKPSERI
jgi:Uri superfamily endonuclease